MARLRRPAERVSIADLAELLERELPVQSEAERAEVQRLRFERAAELGFSRLDVFSAQARRLCREEHDG